jgi:voltage-gated chloride channel
MKHLRRTRHPQCLALPGRGENELTEVSVSTDGGQTWAQAEFVDPVQRHAWRRWKFDWVTPKKLVASLVGRLRNCPIPQLRHLVACGAAARIASAYNAPIVGAFFVAEIVLGTVVVESLGPLILASVTATFLSWAFNGESPIYQSPALGLHTRWEIVPLCAIGIFLGLLAPLYLLDGQRKQLGAVSLHDVKAFLDRPELETVVIAGDIMDENFPCISTKTLLNEGVHLSFSYSRQGDWFRAGK